MFSKVRELSTQLFEWLFLSDIPVEMDAVPSKGTVKMYDSYTVIYNRLIHATVVNNHRAGDITRLEVIGNNADDYIRILHLATAALLGEIDFPREEFKLQLVKVCNFYRDQDGKLGDLDAKRAELLRAMVEFTVVYFKIQSIVTRPANIEYALFRSLTLMLNIDSLSNQFVQPRLD